MYAPLSERTLDLCSGSAILSLVLASRKTAVTAVEWSEYVAAISQVNVALSPYAGHIEIRTGDLFGPVAGSRFDLIVANPPFSPTPIIPGTERAAAGGSDGLQITRRILESANDFLTGNGTLLMLTGMVGTAQNAFFESELQAYANQFHCRIDMIDVREPQPIEKLTIPRYHEEPLVRLQQIHDAASVLRASHYHVGIIRMARNGGPRFSRIGPESRTAGWARAARAYRQLRKKAPM
jgi:23S rRNA G2069 N7-methylase RlmK/C1962 C5-methylase RlmI